MLGYTTFNYVTQGYAVGDSFVYPTTGKHEIKFFVSSGTLSEADLKTSIVATLIPNDIALIHIPESKKILLGNDTGFVEFLGGVDIQAIINDPLFISTVQSLTNVNVNVNMTASIVDSNGGVVSGVTVTQTSPTTFDVVVPQQLVGTNYKIVFNQS